MSRSLANVDLSDRVKRLSDIASELDACESDDEVFNHAVTASRDVITFDAGIIATLERGRFVPRAVNVDRLFPAEPLSAGEGIAGRTLETGSSIIVEDLSAESDLRSEPEAFQSVLSIPLNVDGVLQFLASEPNAFSSTDRELGELLVANVTNALGRVTYERALSRERDQFAALFENVPDAALQYRVEDGEQIVEAVNSSFVRVFGYLGEEVVGKPISSVLDPEDGGIDPELITAEDVERRTDVEVRRETADGSRSFLLRNVPMRTEDECVRGYLIYTDLTALKARERELERQNERLDQFASIVSHDLRNPLNVANGYLELARDRNPCDELDAIGQAHRRMERLIEDVLALARDGGRIDELEPVHLGTAAREAWRNVETADASLSVDADTAIEADASKLLQLLENLFRNAIEHGGHDVSVAVYALEDGFVIEDDGPGIPAIERDSVFESGYSSTHDNTGLGLAIVEQITAAHEWSVTVLDGDDGGARFEFDFQADEASGNGDPSTAFVGVGR